MEQNKYCWPILIIALALLTGVQAQEQSVQEGIFAGRISKLNEEAKLIRFKIAFDNFKYLNKKDVVEMWNSPDPTRKCKGYLLGKTNDHMLVRVPDYDYCRVFVNFGNGAYMKFYSKDLLNNVEMGREAMRIILKKRLALAGEMKTVTSDLDGYLEKMNVINGRYQVLREKLEKEWREELIALEQDRAELTKVHSELKMRLREIDFKVEQYKIADDNLTLDRWSLDSRQYYRK